MSDEGRTTVKTYVPRWQKEEWTDDAEALDMSQSEFLRAMVQAGRRNINIGVEKSGSRDVDPRGGASEVGFEDRVLSVLSDEGTLDWDELLAVMTEGVEDSLDEAIQSLEDRREIRYDPRQGGYTLVDE